MDSDSDPLSATKLVRPAYNTRAAVDALAMSSRALHFRAQEGVDRARATVERCRQRQAERERYLAQKERDRAKASGGSSYGGEAAQHPQPSNCTGHTMVQEFQRGVSSAQSKSKSKSTVRWSR